MKEGGAAPFFLFSGFHFAANYIVVGETKHLLDAWPVRGPMAADGHRCGAPNEGSHSVAEIQSPAGDSFGECMAHCEQINWRLLSHQGLDSMFVEGTAPKNAGVVHPLLVKSRANRTAQTQQIGRIDAHRFHVLLDV